MTYITCRIYTGTSTHTPQQLSDIVAQELVPSLANAGGLLRYITLEFAGDRVGSFSAYVDQNAAERGAKLANVWTDSTGIMSGFRLTANYSGDLLYSFAGDAKLIAGCAGVIRLYDTEASDIDIEKAYTEQEVTIQGFAGLARLSVVRLSQRRVGTFSSYSDRDSANLSTQLARDLRAQAGSQSQKVFPTDPEILEAQVLGVYNG
jgi:hypothetical protein